MRGDKSDKLWFINDYGELEEVTPNSKELTDLLEKFKDAAIEDFLEQSEGSYKNYKNLKEQILALLKTRK